MSGVSSMKPSVLSVLRDEVARGTAPDDEDGIVFFQLGRKSISMAAGETVAKLEQLQTCVVIEVCRGGQADRGFWG